MRKFSFFFIILLICYSCSNNSSSKDNQGSSSGSSITPTNNESYSWDASDWSSCSNGTQTRSIICKNLKGQQVDNTNCSSNNKQTTTQTCSANVYKWYTGNWGSCFNNISKRAVICVDSKNQLALDSLCTETKPDTSKSCTDSSTPTNPSTPTDNSTPTNSSTLITKKVLASNLGWEHACMILEDSSVKCWGTNSSGQLGDGTTTLKDVPVSVKDITNVKKISLGKIHSCALLNDGKVYCWGSKYVVGKGLSSTGDPQTTPYCILNNATDISVGYSNSCAMLTDNTVKCWEESPTIVPNLNNVKEITVQKQAGKSACAVLNDSTVTCWEGSNGTFSKISGISNVKSIGYGDGHFCALLNDGNVQCWGSNTYGQIGDGTTIDKTTPVNVIDNVKKLSVGNFHNCVLLNDNKVKCWGNNFWGQCGNGIVGTNQTTPTEIQNFSNAKEISTGWAYSCALLNDGTVKCFGNNSFGQLGNGNANVKLNPVSSSFINVSEMAIGDSVSCVILNENNGTLKCVGYNNRGSFGNGTSDIASYGIPVDVSNFNSAKKVSISNNSTVCGIDGSNTLKCWGNNNPDNYYGNGFGNGTKISSNVPVNVLSNVQDVALSSHHSCVLLINGTVQCWGRGRLNGGRVGSMFDQDTITPVNVVTTDNNGNYINLSNVKQIAVGGSSSCALLNDNTVKCWGYYTNSENYSSVIAINGLGFSNIKQVALGSNHSCVLSNDGTVMCWGKNGYGQLGNGTKNDSCTLQDVCSLVNVSISDVKQIALSGDFSCALLNDGTVQCWGINNLGQLGDGTMTSSSVPVPVSNLNNVTKIVAGAYTVCAFINDGTIKCWGDNRNGQMGIDIRNMSPVQVKE